MEGRQRGSQQNKSHLKSQGGARATADSASENVTVITRYCKMIIHLPVTALLIFQQKRRMVKCRQFYEAIVTVPKIAPLGPCDCITCQTCSTASCNHMCGRTEWASIVVRSFLRALVLYHSTSDEIISS
jgi:hypothetical protein